MNLNEKWKDIHKWIICLGTHSQLIVKMNIDWHMTFVPKWKKTKIQRRRLTLMMICQQWHVDLSYQPTFHWFFHYILSIHTKKFVTTWFFFCKLSRVHHEYMHKKCIDKLTDRNQTLIIKFMMMIMV